jgi:GrpB-like predicted nucleotidyltransferase (UPF0157 family)
MASYRIIVVVPHDPSWADEFDRSSRAVAEALGGRDDGAVSAGAASVVEIHHIGSTAIPGIYAKPVIDMLAVVADNADGVARLDACNARMAQLGYEAMGEFGIPGRRYFRRDDPATGVRTHQVHAFARGSPDVERHLAFRDYLRVHPADAAAYCALKRRLTATPIGVDAYCDGKDAFIKDVERRALAWRAAQARRGQVPT